MNRSTALLWLVIAVLVVLLVVALVLPAIGEGVRGAVAALFTERGGVADNVVAGVIVALLLAIAGLVWRFGGRVWRTLTSQADDQPPEPISTEPSTERSVEPGVEPRTGTTAERARDDAQEVATQVNSFAHERRLQDPFNNSDLPTDTENVTETPEYREAFARYQTHMDETLRQYGRDLLPDVSRVRGALADEGITDAQLDRVFARPSNYEDIETVALRLWDMAGRLDRKL